MHILVSGSSGLIGSSLVKALLKKGDRVSKLVRPGGPVGEGSILWDPEVGQIELSALENFDAVVHLAGENIAQGRWTDEKKNRIRQSRVKGTTLLTGALRSLSSPPKVAILASAIGYYGDRADELLTENSSVGSGFIAETVAQWEKASEPLEQSATRRAVIRIGVVLTPEGGALKRMLPVFRKGLGGKLGSGKQFFSWMSLPDLIRAILYVLDNDSLSGPINLVSPSPVTNEELTKALASHLKKPALATVPAFVLRLMVGEMADELLLSSTRVIPEQLKNSQFCFDHPELDKALHQLL